MYHINARRIVLLVLLSISVCVFPLNSIMAAQNSGALWGRVRGSGGGVIANAYVTVEGTSFSAWTNAQGSFGISNIPAGWYSVAANKPGFSVARKTIQIQNGMTNWAEFTLSPVGGLWGYVRDKSGSAVSNAYVVLEGAGFATWTDAQGRFSLANIPVGWYSVAVNKPGYSTDRKVLQVQPGINKRVDFAIYPAGTLWGRVLDSSGTPVSNAYVALEGTDFSAWTNAQGKFAIANAPAGWYSVAANKSGYSTARKSVQIKVGSTSWIELVVYPAGTLWGQTKNVVSGFGVNGATVWINTVGSATTGGNGSFGIGGIRPGWYQATARKSGYVQSTRIVQIQANQTSWVNFPLWPQSPANDPYLFTHQWGPFKLNLPDAWPLARGTGTVIAVVDTGVDLGHRDLAGHIVPGYNAISPGASPQDNNGHGTHVAGIAAAITGEGYGMAGTAWDARIMPIKVLDSSGSGYNSWVAEGIRFAANYGARVINLSLGSPYSSYTMRQAVEYAQSKGALVIAAGGNCEPDCYTTQYPAAYYGVVGVAATNQYDSDAYFSSCGNWIDVAAPGTNIWSTLWPQTYGWENGTSMATPFVSGVAALVMSRNPGLSASQVRSLLQNTTRDLKSSGWDSCTGYGLVNAHSAVLQALPASTLELTDTVNSKIDAPSSFPEVEAHIATYTDTEKVKIEKADSVSTGDEPNVEFRPGVVLVQLREDVLTASAESWLSQRGLSVAHVIPDLNIYVVRVPEGQERTMASELAVDSMFTFAELDYVVRLDCAE